jgi:hypothetical protein
MVDMHGKLLSRATLYEKYGLTSVMMTKMDITPYEIFVILYDGHCCAALLTFSLCNTFWNSVEIVESKPCLYRWFPTFSFQ